MVSSFLDAEKRATMKKRCFVNTQTVATPVGSRQGGSGDHSGVVFLSALEKRANLVKLGNGILELTSRDNHSQRFERGRLGGFVLG